MSVSIPVGETLLAFRWSNLGDPEEMVSTLGVIDTGTTDPAETAEKAYIAASSTTSLCPVSGMNQGWTFVGVTAYLQDDPGIRVGIHNQPITAVVGGLVTLPTNCSFLVHKITPLAGRQNRGRMYLPPFGLGEGDVDPNGTILGSSYTTIQNRLDVFRAAMITGTDMALRLFHTVGPSTEVNDLLYDTRIATQRRRMRN